MLGGLSEAGVDGGGCLQPIRDTVKIKGEVEGIVSGHDDMLRVVDYHVAAVSRVCLVLYRRPTQFAPQPSKPCAQLRFARCYEADAGRLILAWLSFVLVLTSGDLQCPKHR